MRPSATQRPATEARDADIDELLKLVYSGPMEALPWQSFVGRTREVLGALALAVVLYPSDAHTEETHVLAAEPGNDTDWAELNRRYIREYIELDPTASDKIAPGQILNIEEFKCGAYFREFLQPLGIEHFIRLRFSAPGGMHCWLSVAKTRDQGPFTAEETRLLHFLLPHLEQALAVYGQIMLAQSEKNLYKEAIELLSFGSILLNGDRRIINANQTAFAIIDQHRELSIINDMLVLADPRGDEEFQREITHSIACRQDEKAEKHIALVRIECGKGGPIGLLIRSTPTMRYYQGRHTPNVIIYVSDLGQHIDGRQDHEAYPQQLIAKLFKLTPTEARLALLLVGGKTLSDAAVDMNITEKTARNHSKNIFAKTGIKRQVDLVRLIYKSVALMG